MKQTTVRMSCKIYDQLVQQSRLFERSVNGQIVWILKQWLSTQGVSDAGLPVELESLGSTEKQEVGKK